MKPNTYPDVDEAQARGNKITIIITLVVLGMMLLLLFFMGD